MCECGCVESDMRYRFPGPDGAFYVLTLSGGCVSCDAGPGILIELLEPGNSVYEPDFLDGDLVFEQWHHARTAAINTGMRKDQFIKATMGHLVGVGAEMFNEDTATIDDVSAEVILEEMYVDSQTKPYLVTPSVPPGDSDD